MCVYVCVCERERERERNLPDINHGNLLAPLPDVVGRPVHNRNQASMRNRAVRAGEDEEIGEIRHAGSDVCFWMVFPLLGKHRAAFAYHVPRRNEAGVEAGSTDDDVKVIARVCGGNACRCDFLDLTGFDPRIGLLESFEITLARRQASASSLVGRDELRAELRVSPQTLLHLLSEHLLGGIVRFATVQQHLEEFIEAVSDVLAQLPKLLRALIELLPLLF